MSTSRMFLDKESSFHRLSNEIKELKFYALIAAVFVLLSYSVYLIFDENTIINLGREDGLFENLTAIFFFTAAIFFLRTYLKSRNIYFLLFFLIFLFGAGEEISWGQRIFHIHTPDYWGKMNKQHEINIHNLKLFNACSKHGLEKLLSINFQYKLFWFFYAFLLPISVLFLQPVSLITQKIRLPVPPITIGIFFIISWLIFRLTLSFLLPRGMTIPYYWVINEIMECNSALIFMLLSVYFFKNSINALDANI